MEYHHPDFFQNDNFGHDIPKGKNSKFFKLCQTLKMPYRLRKTDGNVEVSSKKRRRAELVTVSFDHFILLYPTIHVQGDMFGPPYGPIGGPWPPWYVVRIFAKCICL